MLTPSDAKREILTRLLLAYERSTSFGLPGPWARNVIVRFSETEFPEAFAPDGREELAALYSAARGLEEAGAVRLKLATRSWRDAVPVEARLGPDQVEPAYRMAETFEFLPAVRALAELRAVASGLVGVGPSWLDAFLLEVKHCTDTADLRFLGFGQRERFKRERADVADALRAVAALASGTSGWERVVSERLFHDSKRIASIRPLLVDFLVRADPRWSGIPVDDAMELLEAYGIRRKPGLIRCAGAATLAIQGRSYLLEDFQPVAHLPDSWAEALVAGIAATEVTTITTIENESPFLAYVEEAGGPLALSRRGELVMYIAGFPTPTVQGALSQLASRRADLRFRHWGDADVGGLRIWWFVRRLVGREVGLYRTTAEWVRTAAEREAKLLSPAERAALVKIRGELDREPGTPADVQDARELIDALLDLGMKFEQERY